MSTSGVLVHAATAGCFTDGGQMGSKTRHTVAARSIFLYWDCFRRRRRYRLPVQRQMWVRPWNRDDSRLLFGHWDNLLPQLRQKDLESWFNYMRMRPEKSPVLPRVMPLWAVLLLYSSRVIPVSPILLPLLPDLPVFFQYGPVRWGWWLFSPDLPVSIHFFPFLPASSRAIPDPHPGFSGFSRIANIWRNGPKQDMCNGGINKHSLNCLFVNTGAQLLVHNSASKIPYTLYTNAQNLLHVSKKTFPKSPVWCRNTAGKGHQMSFEWLKDFLSGVSFEVSLPKDIYSRKNNSRSLGTSLHEWRGKGTGNVCLAEQCKWQLVHLGLLITRADDVSRMT